MSIQNHSDPLPRLNEGYILTDVMPQKRNDIVISRIACDGKAVSFLQQYNEVFNPGLDLTPTPTLVHLSEDIKC